MKFLSGTKGTQLLVIAIWSYDANPVLIDGVIAEYPVEGGVPS